MKCLALAALAACAASVFAQNASPSPLPPLDPGKIFQLPPALSGRSPQFKLQMPDGGPSFRLVPPVIEVPRPQSNPPSDLDDAMVIHPPRGSFNLPQARPAMPQKLYPGLQLQPIELASVAPLPTLWPGAKLIPIPITWPDAKFEPIPRNVEGFSSLPVFSTGLAPARR